MQVKQILSNIRLHSHMPHKLATSISKSSCNLLLVEQLFCWIIKI